jgi:hypothetical protein
MNYVEESVGFEKWVEGNYLPQFAQLIWYKLFKRFNRSGWSEWVTVDNRSLMADTQIKSEQSFILYRDKLVEAGLIEYVKGKKGVPNRYKLVSAMKYASFNGVQTQRYKYTPPNGAETIVKDAVQSIVKPVAQTVDITKRKEVKQNETKQYNNRVKSKFHNFTGHERDYDELTRLNMKLVYGVGD